MTVSVPDGAEAKTRTSTITFDTTEAGPVTKTITVTVGEEAVLSTSVDRTDVSAAVGQQTMVTDLTISNPGSVALDITGEPLIRDANQNSVAVTALGADGKTLKPNGEITVPVVADLTSAGRKDLTITVDSETTSQLSDAKPSAETELTIDGIDFDVSADSVSTANASTSTVSTLNVTPSASTTITYDVTEDGQEYTEPSALDHNVTLINETHGDSYRVETNVTHTGNGTYNATLDLAAVTDARHYDTVVRVESETLGVFQTDRLSDVLNVTDTRPPEITNIALSKTVKPDDAKTVSPTITVGAVDNGTGGVSKGVASVTTDIRNKNGDTVEANVTLSDPNGDGTWSNTGRS